MRVPARHKMPLCGAEATLSSSVTSWLGHELELRGIDAVIYTRYILSILQQDDLQFDLQDADFFPHLKKSGGAATGGGGGGSSSGSKVSTPAVGASGGSASSQGSSAGGGGGGERGARGKTRGRKGDSLKRKSAEMDSEKLKKCAAVECLLSVTDEDSGIETLVDELYLKLKEQQAKSAAAEVPKQVMAAADNYESSDSVISTSPEDPAERYYAAFPALSEKCDGLKPKVTSKNAWAKMAQKSPPNSAASSTSRKSDMNTLDVEEFPDTVQDFEKLERDVGKAEALKRSKSREKNAKELQRRTRNMTPENYGQRKGSPKQSRDRGSKSKASPQEKAAEPTKMTIDQIKGKAIFEDVEPETNSIGNRESSVQSQRQGYSNHNVAFIVPKLKAARSKSAMQKNHKEPPTSSETSQVAKDVAKPVMKKQPNEGSNSSFKYVLSRDNSREKSSGDEEVMKTFMGSASRENLLWYMGPLDFMMPTSPVPKDRLYNRHQSASEEEIVKFVRCILSAIETSGSDVKSDHTLEKEIQSSSCESERISTPIISIHSEDETMPSPHNTTCEEFAENLFPEGEECDQLQFSFPWEEEAFSSLAGDVEGSAAISPGLQYLANQEIIQDLILTATEGANKNADCDSGNETDEQREGNETSARPRVRELPKSSDKRSSEEVESEQTLGNEQSGKSAALCEGLQLLDMVGKAESTPLYSGVPRSEDQAAALSPQMVLPWILDLDLEACHTEEIKEEQQACAMDKDMTCTCGKSENHSLPKDMDTGLSPCSDLCSSPKDNLLASEQTGIPTPQSTENEVLDDRPFFCISDTESQGSEQHHSDSMDSWPQPDVHQDISTTDTPEVSSPNLSGLAYLWSEDQDGRCGAMEQEHSPQTAAAAPCALNTKDSFVCGQADTSQSVANSGDTLICDITPPPLFHQRVLDSSSSSLSPPCSSSSFSHQQLTSYATTTLSGTKDIGLWPPVGGNDIWCYPFPSIWSCNLYNQPFVGASLGSWNDHSCPWNTILSHISHHHYSMDSFRTAYSPLQTPSFSPHLGNGLTSQIWDINAQKRMSESPPERSAGSLENGNGYLWGLGIGWRKEASQGVLLKSNLYQFEQLWNLELTGQASNSEIWHSALFDHADLMKVADTHKDPWANVSLEPAHLFRNHSFASVESGETESSGTQVHDWENKLLPSENSAFSRESIPRRLPYLPHVKSEPVLSPTKPSQLSHLEPGGLKLVEVKHLYKSDTSILRELGLASESDEETEEGGSEIEYSPDRHFHPIKTPVEAAQPQESASQEASCANSKASQQSSGSVDMLCSSNRSSGYQLYQGDETVDVSGFIPRFKIHKELEKSAQTGDSPKELPGIVDAQDASLAERLLQDMNRVLKIEEEDGESENEDDLTVHDLDVSVDTESTTGCPPSPTLDVDEALTSAGIASLWQNSEFSAQAHDTEDNTGGEPLPQGSSNYMSIWSCGPQVDLPGMTSDLILSGSSKAARHLSLEEDMRVIPSSSSAAGSVESGSLRLKEWASASEVKVESGLRHIQELMVGFPSEGEAKPATANSKNSSGMEEWATPENDEVFSEDNMDFHALMFPGEMPPVPPGGQAHYLSDLENSWLSSQEAFEVQVPGKRPRGKSGNTGQKKPCTFYMEGKCRRSDCKFAHDTSSITCRFWEEGACFKGITCPFLHGYPGSAVGTGSGEEECSFEVEQPQFSLETEDFPALATLQEERKAKVVPSDSCVVSKRRKLHKNLSDPGENPTTVGGFPSSHGHLKSLREKNKTKSLPIDIKFKTKPLG